MSSIAPSTSSKPKTPKLSKTELGKIDKARRIRDASRALFMGKGFEEATIRDIARLAEVAQGTLFLYAGSKRELLFQLYNDDLDIAVTNSCAFQQAELSPMEFLLQTMLQHLIQVTDDIAIAKCALIHLNLYDGSEQSARFVEICNTMIEAIRDCLHRSADENLLHESADYRLIGEMTYSLIVERMRRYIRSDVPDMQKAMQSIKGQLTVVLNGLGASPEALVVNSPAINRWL